MNEYTKKTAFINRAKELSFLWDWVNETPEYMLFIYGPKSSGKTTLLYKFVRENLEMKGYDVKYFNLREILITSYKDFLQAFFEVDHSGAKELKQTRKYNLGVFKLDVEVLKRLDAKELDPFAVMKKELKKLNQNGIRPLIILDELQALEDIYMNGQRELIKELFNFFVAMTKESHLCHIIISSSDGYFVEKIYNDSKLKKTSDFFSVDYLNKADMQYWLNNIEKESGITRYCLTESQIEKIWDNMGGSPAEVSRVLGDLIMVAKDNKVTDEDVDGILQKYLIAAKAMFLDYAGVHEKKWELFNKIDGIVKGKEKFVEIELESLVREKFYDANSLRDELNNLVRNNFLALDPMEGTYALQGRSMEKGLGIFVKMITEERAG